MHYHRTDLRDLWRPGGGESRMTWRMLGNLIRHLPAESATKTALRNKLSDTQIKQYGEDADPSQGQWSHEAMILASIHDALRSLQAVVIRVNGGKAKQPDPMPRPGVRPKHAKKRKPRTAEHFDEVFRRINGGRISGGTWHHSRPSRATHQQQPT
jgi:hypothetical protein